MPDVPPDLRWLVPRDKPGLLIAAMRALAGGARMSLEGNLGRCAFPPGLAASPDEAPPLTRATLWPRQDFVVLPLEPHTVRPILGAILPANRFMTDVIHVQIERGGRIEFAAYDQFHKDCVVGYGGLPDELLNRLLRSGVLRAWSPPYAGAQRWHG